MTKLEQAKARWRADYEARMKDPSLLRRISANLGNGPAHDYNKGPGNWTGD